MSGARRWGGAGRLLYRGLLRLLPRSFRGRHAAEIEQTFAAGNGAAGAGYGLGAALDLAWGALAEWGRALRSLSLAGVGKDVQVAARGLRRSPGFTLIATMALALGVGANATVFSLVNEIVVRPLPVRQPGRLVNIYVDQPGANSFTGFSWPEYQDYRAARGALEDVAVLSATGLRFGEPGGEARVGTTMVSDGYFEVLGVGAVRGRLFTPLEVDAAAEVVVVSHGFWQRRLGGRDDVVGLSLRLSDIAFTVVGVAPEGFTGTFIGFPTELWIPATLLPRVRPGAELASRREQPFEMLGRLAAGTTAAGADAALDAVAAELESAFPVMYRERRVKVYPLTGIDQSLYDGVMGFVGVLLALSGLVLLTACLNVGGMLLARGDARAGEMALRAALGAPRGLLVRQVVVEGLILFGLGTAVALLVAWQLNAALRRLIEVLPVPLGFDLALDRRVLAVTLAVGFATALATALAPALRVSGARPRGALGAGGRQTGGSQRVRGAFLVGQVALSLVLLVSAALFVRAAQRGAALDAGFDLAALTSTTIGLPAERYGEQQAERFFADLARRLEASPMVEAATWAGLPPIDVARNTGTVRVPGQVDRDGDDQWAADVHPVGDGYFSTVGLPLLEGRALVPADGTGTGRVAVLNRTAAQTIWGDGGALGRELLLDGEPVTVIGVVGDSRTVIQDAAPAPLLYLPAAHRPSRRMSLVTRSGSDIAALNRLVRAEVAALDTELPPPSTRPLSELVELSLLPQRLAARFAGALGGLALVLAISGVYGIVAYAVGRRRRELGIRTALGGQPGGMVLLVMRGGLLLVTLGIVTGVLGLALLTPLLRQFLLDVSAFDPLALAAAVSVLLATAAVACWLPARQAARVDPVVALRAD